MTDNLQLQTTRLTNASAGNLIDTSIADIENAISVLFGITKDAVIDPPMSIAANGNVTMLGDLTLAGAPSVALHCSTKKYVDDNATGGGGYACSIVDGAAYVAASSTGFMSFSSTPDVEEGDSGQFDYSTDATKIICKSAGDYLILGNMAWDSIDSGPDFDRETPFNGQFELYVNGANIADAVMGKYSDNTVVYDIYGTFGVMRTLAENDYIQLRANNLNNDENHPSSCRLTIIKLS
jgi:hypothetical protein